MRVTQIGAKPYAQMGGNKRETVEKTEAGLRLPPLLAELSRKPASENLSHREARYAFPSVRRYKSPNPARFEERYKRVGRYHFHPKSRSLSNGLSSFLPSWPEEWSGKESGAARDGGGRGQATTTLLAFRLTLSDRGERPTLWDPITKRLTLIKD